jgi:hypothetical protein
MPPAASIVTDDFYLAFMRDRRVRINHYLMHGVVLRIPGG